MACRYPFGSRQLMKIASNKDYSMNIILAITSFLSTQDVLQYEICTVLPFRTTRMSPGKTLLSSLLPFASP